MINNLFLGFIVVLNFINLLSIREIFTHLFMNDNVIYIGIMLFESTYTWTSFLIFVKMVLIYIYIYYSIQGYQ